MLLERFREELAPLSKENVFEDLEDDEKNLSLCLKMIRELCDKMKLRSEINYFIEALNLCHNRYPEAHHRKVLIAALFILVLSRLRGVQMISRVEKEQILTILDIRSIKQAELKQWIELFKQDDFKYGWLDSVFEKKFDQLMETSTEPESSYQAISGIGMMIHPQVDFYGDKHYSEYLKWKKGILTKISQIKKSKCQINE